MIYFLSTKPPPTRYYGDFSSYFEILKNNASYLLYIQDFFAPLRFRYYYILTHGFSHHPYVRYFVVGWCWFYRLFFKNTILLKLGLYSSSFIIPVVCWYYFHVEIFVAVDEARNLKSPWRYYIVSRYLYNIILVSVFGVFVCVGTRGHVVVKKKQYTGKKN